MGTTFASLTRTEDARSARGHGVSATDCILAIMVRGMRRAPARPPRADERTARSTEVAKSRRGAADQGHCSQASNNADSLASARRRKRIAVVMSHTAKSDATRDSMARGLPPSPLLWNL